MDVLAVSLALAAHVFPFACHQPNPPVETYWAPMHRYTLAYAEPETCRIYFNKHWWDRLTAAGKATLVLHEYSHLAGMGHSTNPRSVRYTPWTGRIDPRARRVIREGRYWLKPRSNHG